MAGDALDFDFAVQGVQVGPHYVKAYAAACEFGLNRGSRESGMEEHFAHVAFCEPVGGFHGNQAALDGALLHALVINAAAIVLDFDIDVVAAVIGAQRDFSGARLACRNAIAAELDSMGYGVTHEMDEGV